MDDSCILTLFEVEVFYEVELWKNEVTALAMRHRAMFPMLDLEMICLPFRSESSFFSLFWREK
jgi:hypothetical protein